MHNLHGILLPSPISGYQEVVEHVGNTRLGLDIMTSQSNLGVNLTLKNWSLLCKLINTLLLPLTTKYIRVLEGNFAGNLE